MSFATGTISTVLTLAKRQGRGMLLLLGMALMSAATLSACGGGDSPAAASPAGSSTSTPTAPTTPTAPVTPAAPAAQSFGFSPTATREGTVQFPTGAVETLDALTVVNGFGTAPVSATGTFTVSTLSSSAQYAAITTQAGVPLLVGWLGDAEPVINAHTTAEVYVYFAAFIYAVPDAASRTAIIASISSLSGLGTVEQAISAALIASPTTSPSSNAAVVAAIKSLVTDLLTSGAPAASGIKAIKSLLTSRPDSLLFNPSTSASGITIVDNGQNSIQFQNTLRRGAEAFVDEVSHVDASGNTVTDNAPDTNPPVTIPAVTALGSFGGSIANYMAGNYALVPVLTALQEVPNLPGAKSTTYRIAIVGPGGQAGDYNSLTKVEQEVAPELVTKTLIYEVTLPLLASVFVPAGEFGEIQFDTGTVDAIIKDTINTIAATNSVAEAAESGDPEAVYNAVVAVLAGNASLVEPLLEAVVTVLNVSAKTAGATSLALAEKTLVLPLQLVDGGIAVADALFVIKDMTSADKGDLFTVVATDPSTTLTPATSNIAVNATVTLTAAVHPPQTLPVVYQYTNTALFGHLTDGTGAGHLDNFVSSSATVTYTGSATGGGTDTITVTPQYVVTGLPNESLATASATVTVNATPPQTTVLGTHTSTETYQLTDNCADSTYPDCSTFYVYIWTFFTFQTQPNATSYTITYPSAYWSGGNGVGAYSVTYTAAQVAAFGTLTDITNYPAATVGNGITNFGQFQENSNLGGGLIGLPFGVGYGPGTSSLQSAWYQILGASTNSMQLDGTAPAASTISGLQAQAAQGMAMIPAAAYPTLTITQ